MSLQTLEYVVACLRYKDLRLAFTAHLNHVFIHRDPTNLLSGCYFDLDRIEQGVQEIESVPELIATKQEQHREVRRLLIPFGTPYEIMELDNKKVIAIGQEIRIKGTGDTGDRHKQKIDNLTKLRFYLELRPPHEQRLKSYEKERLCAFYIEGGRFINCLLG